MKKGLIIIRNVIVGIVMVAYFAFIVAISTLLLNRNDYGVTQFGESVMILVDKEITNKDYPEGTLAIVEKRKLEDLVVGDEVFIYQTNKKDKSVDIVISEVESINLDVDSPYITITNNGTAWGEEFVAGVSTKTYADLGGFLKFIQSKWVFFILLIIPCFFILLYEIYLLIIAIRFDDEDEVSESDEKLEDLAKQLEELKKANGEENEEKLDDLMAQLNSLRKEYDQIDEEKEEVTEVVESVSAADKFEFTMVINDLIAKLDEFKDVEIETEKADTEFDRMIDDIVKELFVIKTAEVNNEADEFNFDATIDELMKELDVIKSQDNKIVKEDDRIDFEATIDELISELFTIREIDMVESAFDFDGTIDSLANELFVLKDIEMASKKADTEFDKMIDDIANELFELKVAEVETREQKMDFAATIDEIARELYEFKETKEDKIVDKTERLDFEATIDGLIRELDQIKIDKVVQSKKNNQNNNKKKNNRNNNNRNKNNNRNNQNRNNNKQNNNRNNNNRNKNNNKNNNRNNSKKHK